VHSLAGSDRQRTPGKFMFIVVLLWTP